MDKSQFSIYTHKHTFIYVYIKYIYTYLYVLESAYFFLTFCVESTYCSLYLVLTPSTVYKLRIRTHRKHIRMCRVKSTYINRRKLIPNSLCLVRIRLYFKSNINLTTDYIVNVPHLTKFCS